MKVYMPGGGFVVFDNADYDQSFISATGGLILEDANETGIAFFAPGQWLYAEVL